MSEQPVWSGQRSPKTPIVYRRSPMRGDDDSRVLLVLDRDQWTSITDIRYLARMDTSRCCLALKRLVARDQAEFAKLRRPTGRPVHLYRKRQGV